MSGNNGMWTDLDRLADEAARKWAHENGGWPGVIADRAFREGWKRASSNGDQVAIAALEAAHAEARANTRRAWDELDDNDVARHWSAVAGWLRHRIRKLQAGEEPDWPDAFMHTASGAS